MITQTRLVELQTALPSSSLSMSLGELKELVDELLEQRAARVKLQGEIERLTHENAGLREHLNHAGETLFDAADRAEKKQAGVEALAQRLAKVEDRLARLNSVAPELNKRIDHVCEIIGTRIGGLEERLARLEQQPERFVLHDNVKVTNAPFPTGAGTTVEDALAQEVAEAEIEPLKPQRGDRVRLEGAKTPTGRPISGWFDVVGGDESEIQIADGFARPWVLRSDPGLKEVRRGAANLPE